MSQENLPIELKNNQLAQNKRENKRKIEGLKRVGKIALSAGASLSGIALSAIGGPVVSTVGLALYVGGATNAVMDTMYKKISKDSMFVQRKKANGEIYISQSVKDVKSFQKMKGFNSREKAAMMGLELLVEMQSIKQQFEDKGVFTQESRNGESNVYPQIYSTTTHGINIKTMEALEELGYLQIERKEPKRKSNLLFEKLGFGQYKEAKDALFSMFSKDKADNEVQMYDIAMKVTDKPINFEEIYEQYRNSSQDRANGENRRAIRSIGTILEVLRNRNIDIVKNDIGETVIDYKAEEPFAKRMKRELTNSSEEYRKANYIGDKIQQGPVQSQEKDEESLKKEVVQENETER